jgi:hypothetical protein
MHDVYLIEDFEIIDCTFTGLDFPAITPGRITMVRSSIFVNSVIGEGEHKNIFYDKCTFIGCTGLPPRDRMWKCRVVELRDIP